MMPLKQSAAIPPFTTAGPISPPTREWEAETGIPRKVTSQSHRAEVMSPIATIGRVITSGLTTPFPIVFATLSAKTNNAAKLKNAARRTAVLGFSTLVETIVAIEFAASFIPFRRSNIRATIIVIITKLI